jgi:ATP-binding cassette subfamily B protein
MGFFSGLDSEAYDRRYRDRDLVRRMIGYFTPYRRRLLVASLGVLIVALGGAGTPILVSSGVDMIAEKEIHELTSVLVGGLFALGVIIWGANWVGRRLITRSVGDVMLDLRRDAFIAATGHDLSFFDEFSTGRIVSRVTSDSQEFARVVVLITDLVSQILQAIFLLVVLARINGRLTLWLLAMMPVIFLVAMGFRRIARQVTRRGFRAMANVNAAIKEAVTGIVIAKNFRQEATIYHEFDEVNQQSYRINVRRGFILATIFPTLDALSGVGTAILVYAGGLSAAGGVITVGAWYLFISSLNRFWFPILNLSAFWTNIQNGLSAAERVFALIDAESAVTQIAHQSVPALRGEVNFEGLSFHYKPGEPVLSGFDLHIRPGENLALVGHTGAGKSSIARLISRFYEFQGGRLLIDGKDIRTFNLYEYRRQLGIVSQTPFLFSGSVLDNIRYASSDVSKSEIEEMARQIGEGAWLETLPDALKTEVEERGANLSMGQRQLVALMRVLVQCPAIFILDEATASVDPFTETQIQQAVSMILSGSTSIVIAHRLSTIREADRIIVLREGEIVEEGDHISLMTQGGHYAELYNTYFRHQSLEYIEQVRQAALGD